MTEFSTQNLINTYAFDRERDIIIIIIKYFYYKIKYNFIEINFTKS